MEPKFDLVLPLRKGFLFPFRSRSGLAPQLDLVRTASRSDEQKAASRQTLPHGVQHVFHIFLLNPLLHCSSWWS
jgi:hypothetical protein